MNGLVTTLAPLFLIVSSSFLQVARTPVKSWMRSKFCLIRPQAAELAALERQKKTTTYAYNGRNVGTTLVSSFLDESSPFLQVKRTTIKA